VPFAAIAWARLFLIALALAQPPAAPMAAQAAQEVHLAGMAAGEQLNDAELEKGTNIVIVWACWSPSSRDIVDRVHSVAGHWKARARILTIDFEEDRPTIKAFLGGRTLDVPIFLDADGALSKKYAVATLPGLLVVVDGKVRYHGKLPEDPDRLLTDLLHQ
jgi:hypothetical protein